ncbi:hypothetical protein FRB94_006657 [Tulasnella sp. JGI-2019a]|nr:hypothetical protein FRB94_006657 [Tulasnella sp. JGI-2019a]
MSQAAYNALVTQITALTTHLVILTTNVNNLTQNPPAAPQIIQVATAAPTTHTQFNFAPNPTNTNTPSITTSQVNQLPLKGPKVATPDKYDRKKQGNKAYKFIAACKQYITLSAQQFVNDNTLINWAIGYLSKDVHKWAQIVLRDMALAQGQRIIVAWVKFKNLFFSTFRDLDHAAKAENMLCNLRQTASASAYAANFN